MPIHVIVTRNFDHMSEVAAVIVRDDIRKTLREKEACVLGLATGNSPTGMYKHLARMANGGEFDSSRIRSFNLDEYVGLPGKNAQQRAMHHESYCFFMIKELFSLLDRKFIETSVPPGCVIEQKRLETELKKHRADWREEGEDAGRSIRIKANPASGYLGWVRRTVLEGYAGMIRQAGGIDLQVIGVGGRGHVAFHESGIPFRSSRVMLVKLDDNTIGNAVLDGHFPSRRACPRHAVTMGAELIYKARTVLLLANGERKTRSVAESLLGEPDCRVPISYGQTYAERGGRLIYVVDRTAALTLLENRELLRRKGIIIDMRA